MSKSKGVFNNKIIISIIIITIISICFPSFVFIFYVINFYGGISNLNSDWGTLGDYFGGIVSPFLSIITIILLLISLYLQRKEYNELEKRHKEELSVANKELNLNKKYSRIQIYNNFVELYRSKDMLDNVDLLWCYYDKSQNMKKSFAEYCLDIHRQQNPLWDKLNHARRYISQFYQHISILIEYDYIEKDLVYTSWNKRVLEIIEKILIPFETEVLGEIINVDKINIDIRWLKKLFDNAPK